uniref:CCHC-type domain-containing protein n=1 Tax=Macrostomum lignano TaxID=282301 RepID=A0A1I8JLY3_9PLAT
STRSASTVSTAEPEATSAASVETPSARHLSTGVDTDSRELDREWRDAQQRGRDCEHCVCVYCFHCGTRKPQAPPVSRRRVKSERKVPWKKTEVQLFRKRLQHCVCVYCFHCGTGSHKRRQCRDAEREREYQKRQATTLSTESTQTVESSTWRDAQQRGRDCEHCVCVYCFHCGTGSHKRRQCRDAESLDREWRDAQQRGRDCEHCVCVYCFHCGTGSHKRRQCRDAERECTRSDRPDIEHGVDTDSRELDREWRDAQQRGRDCEHCVCVYCFHCGTGSHKRRQCRDAERPTLSTESTQTVESSTVSGATPSSEAETASTASASTVSTAEPEATSAASVETPSVSVPEATGPTLSTESTQTVESSTVSGATPSSEAETASTASASTVSTAEPEATSAASVETPSKLSTESRQRQLQKVGEESTEEAEAVIRERDCEHCVCVYCFHCGTEATSAASVETPSVSVPEATGPTLSTESTQTVESSTWRDAQQRGRDCEHCVCVYCFHCGTRKPQSAASVETPSVSVPEATGPTLSTESTQTVESSTVSGATPSSEAETASTASASTVSTAEPEATSAASVETPERECTRSDRPDIEHGVDTDSRELDREWRDDAQQRGRDCEHCVCVYCFHCGTGSHKRRQCRDAERMRLHNQGKYRGRRPKYSYSEETASTASASTVSTAEPEATSAASVETPSVSVPEATGPTLSTESTQTVESSTVSGATPSSEAETASTASASTVSTAEPEATSAASVETPSVSVPEATGPTLSTESTQTVESSTVSGATPSSEAETASTASASTVSTAEPEATSAASVETPSVSVPEATGPTLSTESTQTVESSTWRDAQQRGRDCEHCVCVYCFHCGTGSHKRRQCRDAERECTRSDRPDIEHGVDTDSRELDREWRDAQQRGRDCEHCVCVYCFPLRNRKPQAPPVSRRRASVSVPEATGPTLSTESTQTVESSTVSGATPSSEAETASTASASTVSTAEPEATSAASVETPSVSVSVPEATGPTLSTESTQTVESSTVSGATPQREPRLRALRLRLLFPLRNRKPQAPPVSRRRSRGKYRGRRPKYSYSERDCEHCVCVYCFHCGIRKPQAPPVSRRGPERECTTEDDRPDIEHRKSTQTVCEELETVSGATPNKPRAASRDWRATGVCVYCFPLRTGSHKRRQCPRRAPERECTRSDRPDIEHGVDTDSRELDREWRDAQQRGRDCEHCVCVYCFQLRKPEAHKRRQCRDARAPDIEHGVDTDSRELDPRPRLCEHCVCVYDCFHWREPEATSAGQCRDAERKRQPDIEHGVRHKTVESSTVSGATPSSEARETMRALRLRLLFPLRNRKPTSAASVETPSVSVPEATGRGSPTLSTESTQTVESSTVSGATPSSEAETASTASCVYCFHCGTGSHKRRQSERKVPWKKTEVQIMQAETASTGVCVYCFHCGTGSHKRRQCRDAPSWRDDPSSEAETASTASASTVSTAEPGSHNAAAKCRDAERPTLSTESTQTVESSTVSGATPSSEAETASTASASTVPTAETGSHKRRQCRDAERRRDGPSSVRSETASTASASTVSTAEPEATSAASVETPSTSFDQESERRPASEGRDCRHCVPASNWFHCGTEEPLSAASVTRRVAERECTRSDRPDIRVTGVPTQTVESSRPEAESCEHCVCVYCFHCGTPEANKRRRPVSRTPSTVESSTVSGGERPAAEAETASNCLRLRLLFPLRNRKATSAASVETPRRPTLSNGVDTDGRELDREWRDGPAIARGRETASTASASTVSKLRENRKPQAAASVETPECVSVPEATGTDIEHGVDTQTVESSTWRDAQQRGAEDCEHCVCVYCFQLRKPEATSAASVETRDAERECTRSDRPDIEHGVDTQTVESSTVSGANDGPLAARPRLRALCVCRHYCVSPTVRGTRRKRHQVRRQSVRDADKVGEEVPWKKTEVTVIQKETAPALRLRLLFLHCGIGKPQAPPVVETPSVSVPEATGPTIEQAGVEHRQLRSSTVECGATQPAASGPRLRALPSASYCFHCGTGSHKRRRSVETTPSVSVPEATGPNIEHTESTQTVESSTVSGGDAQQRGRDCESTGVCVYCFHCGKPEATSAASVDETPSVSVPEATGPNIEHGVDTDSRELDHREGKVPWKKTEVKVIQKEQLPELRLRLLFPLRKTGSHHSASVETPEPLRLASLFHTAETAEATSAASVETTERECTRSDSPTLSTESRHRQSEKLDRELRDAQQRGRDCEALRSCVYCSNCGTGSHKPPPPECRDAEREVYPEATEDFEARSRHRWSSDREAEATAAAACDCFMREPGSHKRRQCHESASLPDRMVRRRVEPVRSGSDAQCSEATTRTASTVGVCVSYCFQTWRTTGKAHSARSARGRAERAVYQKRGRAATLRHGVDTRQSRELDRVSVRGTPSQRGLDCEALRLASKCFSTAEPEATSAASVETPSVSVPEATGPTLSKRESTQTVESSATVFLSGATRPGSEAETASNCVCVYCFATAEPEATSAAKCRDAPELRELDDAVEEWRDAQQARPRLPMHCVCVYCLRTAEPGSHKAARQCRDAR